jgi:hypothetical protein
MNHFKSGDKIEIRINSADLSQEKWKPGVFLSYVPAKIGHNYNVCLENGEIMYGVKPDCVRKKSG